MRYYISEESMPETAIRIYQEAEGDVPLLDWLDELSLKARNKCIAKIERLRDRGYELRRPD